jgi:dTDP-3,4-didehydro-2,6-dideoxy-alpha-D-glucose 3-reductase
MKKLRIGIMGCASIARRFVIGALRSMPEFELVAVASRDKEKAERFAGEHGLEPVVGYQPLVERTDLDAVYVPLPTGLHAYWAGRLLQSGKHVMCEKSLACNHNEAVELVSYARAHDLVLMEHFQFIHHHQTEFMLKQISEGSIGEIRVMRASFGFPPLDPGNFRYASGLGGGALLDAGAYTLRAAQLYLGSEIRVRAAVMGGDAAHEADLRGAALVESASGVVAELAWGFDHFYQCAVEVWGTRGRLLQDRAFTAPPGFNATVILEQDGRNVRHQLPADNHFVNLWRYFHAQVVEGIGRESTLKALEDQARLIEEVRRSASEKDKA